MSSAAAIPSPWPRPDAPGGVPAGAVPAGPDPASSIPSAVPSSVPGAGSDASDSVSHWAMPLLWTRMTSFSKGASGCARIQSHSRSRSVSDWLP